MIFRKNKMKEKPLVSICIPTYNGSHFVSRALESCLKQSYENIEVVVVDDTSKDDTIGIVKKYQKKSLKIKLYRNKENLGAAANFLETFRLANGEFIQHLGQDDWLEQNHISEKVAVFEQYPDIAFVANCYSFYILDDKGEPVLVKKFCKKPGFHYDKEVFKRFYREAGLIGFFCMMRKKDVIEQYLVDIPNDFNYERYYRKATIIDNLLPLRILSLKKYRGQYFYIDKTSYCKLIHSDCFSKDYGWIKVDSIDNQVKSIHIDRVGFEFFYKNQAPKYLFSYRVFVGCYTISNIIFYVISGRARGFSWGMLNLFFKDYSLTEKIFVFISFFPYFLRRAIKWLLKWLLVKFKK